MQLLFPNDETLCLPITIGTGSSETGPRLGGAPPEGVVPSKRTNLARFFMTLPLSAEGESEVSVFLGFDFDQMANVTRRVLGPADDLIEVIEHEKRARGRDSDEFLSEVSPHPLIIGVQSPDWFITGGERVIESGHKIGGRPYVEQPRSTLLREMDSMMAEGFRQFVQIGFPGGRDSDVEGDWPFGDGIFHLFMKKAATIEWRWMWEF